MFIHSMFAKISTIESYIFPYAYLRFNSISVLSICVVQVGFMALITIDFQAIDSS